MKGEQFNIMIRLSQAVLVVVVALSLSLAAVSQCRADNRLLLATQFNWQQNEGYYIDLENHANSYGAVQPLSSLALVLGVADGSSWRFVVSVPNWQYNHAYHLKAVISAKEAKLLLDGQVVGSSSGAFAPDTTDAFFANVVPTWACEDAQYWIAQGSVGVRSGATSEIEHMFPPTKTEIEKYMFTPQQTLVAAALATDADKPLTIDSVFTLVDKASYPPLVDKYGQNRIQSWPGKIASDRQLIESTGVEQAILSEMPGQSNVDQFGGDTNAGWSLPATGYFTTTNRNGYWWLISPDGNPCFYTGIDTFYPGDSTLVATRPNLFEQLPAKTGEFAAAYGAAWGDQGPTDYFSFPISNAIRKYGHNWYPISQALFAERSQKWGFTGMGKWSSPFGASPYIGVLFYPGVPLVDGSKPDIFDPNIQADLYWSLYGQMLPAVQDPRLVGWSVGNEYSEIVQYSTCYAVLHQASPTPAKVALVNFALDAFYNGNVAAMAADWNVQANTVSDFYGQSLTAPTSEQETIREYYEDAYYTVLYRIVKAIDPNHLYLGDWVVPYWWVNQADWNLVAAHSDVVGYDSYTYGFDDSNVASLAQQVNKPVLCGEFSYPETNDGLLGFGDWLASGATTNADAGAFYNLWMAAAAQNPNCIGGCWFEYRDEPISGRGPGGGDGIVIGENYAFGIMDVTDQPKWDLIFPMAATNLDVTALRLQVSAGGTAATAGR